MPAMVPRSTTTLSEWTAATLDAIARRAPSLLPPPPPPRLPPVRVPTPPPSEPEEEVMADDEPAPPPPPAAGRSRGRGARGPRLAPLPTACNLYVCAAVPLLARDETYCQIAPSDRLGAAFQSFRDAPEEVRARWMDRARDFRRLVGLAEENLSPDELANIAQRREDRLRMRRTFMESCKFADDHLHRQTLYLSADVAAWWIARGRAHATARARIRSREPELSARELNVRARIEGDDQMQRQRAPPPPSRADSDDDPQMRAAIAASLRDAERTPPHGPVVAPDPAPVHGGLAELGALSTTEEVVSAITCVVCMDKPRNALYSKCGHLCVCQDCAAKTERKCPICRAVSGVQLVRLC